MKKMFLNHRKGILVPGALAILILRWPLLQLLAWAGMFVRYVDSYGFVSGFRMTFSGDHPCALCQAVREGVQTDATSLADPSTMSLIYTGGIVFLVVYAGFLLVTRNGEGHE